MPTRVADRILGAGRVSGLPVARREPQDIAQLFGPAFTLIHCHRERHTTPSGVAQSFAYALLRKGAVT